MAQVYIKYNPYRLETLLQVDGREVTTDSILFKTVKGKRLQEWVGQFPQNLVDELQTMDFVIDFYGMELDYDDVEDAFKNAKKDGIIKEAEIRFIKGKTDEDIKEKIVRIFADLKDGPIDDFREPKLLKKFESVNNAVFPVNVIATMSSGKSTLINALLGKKLMPSKNEACTATITEILDNDGEFFSAVSYNESNEVLHNIPKLTYEIMNELNEDEKVHKIAAKGNIPFLDAKTTALELVDTPGPNNSQNQSHKNTTYRAINNDSHSLILYVLNGTQLGTNDDASLLHYVAEQMQKGGKQVRDRFLFVINKMDDFNPEEEDIEKAIQRVKKYLSEYGIEDPQIFPCSAYTALNIRTCLEGVDIDNLTRNEEKKLSLAARDTLAAIDKFVEYQSMHLEKYSTLSPSTQRELEYKLKQAEERGDTKEQALIHCGIYSIEAAITAYVKKYAKTKKVKELVESFQETLESSQILTKAKTRVAEDKKAAEECAKRASIVKEKIASGKEAKIFKEEIDKINPIEKIEEEAEKLRIDVEINVSRVFQIYGDFINNKEEAKRLVKQFALESSNEIARLTSNLESVIDREVMKTGENMLSKYQEKLLKIDETANDKQLNFDTVDLIKGELSIMRERIGTWYSDDFASEITEDVGEVDYEEKVSYEKVGEEEEEIIVGSHQEKIGTRTVKVGSHQEKAGTRSVKNPDRKWWNFWVPKKIDEEVYRNVDDYEEEDVYETILDFDTVIRDIYEKKVEQIEKYMVEVSAIQMKLIANLREKLDEGIESAVEYTKEQIESMKAQFKGMFDELDQLIQQKYNELEKCANDQKEKEAILEKNKKLLGWIEACKGEIDEVLNI